MLSILPAHIIISQALVQGEDGCNALDGIIQWFKLQFKVEQPDMSSIDELMQKNSPADGVDPAGALVDACQEVVLKGKGSAEQLCVLFIALLRGAGLLVRLVR